MKWLHGLIVALVCLAPVGAGAWWQSRDSNYNSNIASGGGGATIVPGASVVGQNPGFAPGTITFTGLNGGTNYPSGSVVFVGFIGDQAATSLTTPLIGGQTATLVSGATDASLRCQTFTATMPSSQADTFSFTNGAGFDHVAAVGVYFTGITATPTATSFLEYGSASAAAIKPGSAIAIPTGGFGWTFGGTNNVTVATGNTVTWATATPSFITASGGDTNAVLNNKNEIASAHTTKALTGGTSWQPSFTASSYDMAFAACMGAIAVGP